MWDNAPLLKSIANTLAMGSVLAVLAGVVYYLVHLPGLFPLQRVHLSAAPQQVSVEQVLQTLRHETHGNFFTVDIDRLRQSLEKLAWVRGVSIRREFPHRLTVQLEEHQVLARWNPKGNDSDALVNQQGEVFSVDDGIAHSQQTLPSFIGPDGSSAEVALHYADFSRQLQPLGLQAMQLALSVRHAWQLRLSNGMVLELGREDMEQRLARFVAVKKIEDMEDVKYVDLRYRNGLAVKRITNAQG